MSPEKRVNIVTESTAVNQTIIDRYGVKAAYYGINIVEKGKQTIMLRDTLIPNIPEFSNKLKDKKLDIKTSAPIPGELVRLFDELKGRDTLFIHMSSELSKGTSESATIAKSYGYDNVKIYDTGSICLISRFVIKAAQLAEEGKSRDQIVESLDDLKKRSVLLVTVNEMDHLKKSGRAAKALALITKFTGRKPILDVRGNNVDLYGLKKNIGEAIALMRNTALSLDPEDIMIFHGGDEKCEKDARELAMDIFKTTDGKIHPEVAYGGQVATAHTGPEVVAVGIFSKGPIPEKLSKPTEQLISP
jgi:DegV family protein with EDD domain